MLSGGLLQGVTTTDAQAAAVPTTSTLAFATPAVTTAPADHIAESDISVRSDGVFISVNSPVWAKFTPSGSMKPVFDTGANAIEVVPTDASQIKVGDIVSYQATWNDAPVVHRVIETGTDADGWFAVMKGDNNSTSDPGKVRWSQIRRMVVAIIY